MAALKLPPGLLQEYHNSRLTGAGLLLKACLLGWCLICRIFVARSISGVGGTALLGWVVASALIIS